MTRFLLPLLAVVLLIGCGSQGEKGANKGSDVPTPAKKDKATGPEAK